MKIIELLNKIAKGEEVPKEIYYKKQWWKYNPENDYEGTAWGGCFLNNVLICDLNDELEIIIEEKDIEELPIIKNADNTTSLQGKDYNYTMKTVDVILANKINELVREVRKLKESK